MGSCRTPTAATIWCYFSFLCVLGYYCCVSSEGQQVPPAMYVFGDSLVDVGNNNHLQFSQAKAGLPHYGVDYPGGKATGRFSNGKNAADFLAEKVGLPTSPPYLSDQTGTFLQGVSFASAGAGIFNGTDDNEPHRKQSIHLTEQIEYYSTVQLRMVRQQGSSATQAHLSKSVFAVVIGSNDLFGYFKSDSESRRQYTPQQYVDLMVTSLETHLTRLRGLGARKFMITGIGVVGCSPGQRIKNRNHECNQEANFWATKYNLGLRSMLSEFQSETKHVFYSYFDVYKFFSKIHQNPAAYGFKESKSACCGLGELRAEVPCLPISSYCSNRSDHVYWDPYHPSQAAAQIFADFIFNGSQEYVTPINLKQLLQL